MNILICNDDGPEALGLLLLREEVRRRYKEAKIVTMTTHKPMTGQGMAISTSREAKDIKTEKLEKDFYQLKARPVDIIYHAFTSDKYLPESRTWDAVICGVNHGQNVGLDVYHSGTVGMAMVATRAFGCNATAFGQAMEETEPKSHDEDRPYFLSTSKYLMNYFQNTALLPGECWNVNFPADPAQGMKSVPVAHYSRWRPLPTEIVPRARNESSDITELNRGFITISELELRVNPAMDY